MDDLTTEVFERRTVTAGGYEVAREEIQAACRVIFRYPLMPEDLMELIAAREAPYPPSERDEDQAYQKIVRFFSK